MRRRSSPRRSSPLRWLVWAGGLLLVAGVVLALALPSLITGYLRRFVRSDALPPLLETMIEARLGGATTLSPPVWSDDTAAISDVDIETGPGWQFAARSARVAVDFGAVRRGAWHLTTASADEITLTRLAPTEAPAESISTESAGLSMPSWVTSRIPKTLEVDGFDCERFSLLFGAWQIEHSRLALDAYNSASSGGRFSVPGSLQNGKLLTPLKLPNQKEALRLDVTSAAFRLAEDRLQVTEAALRWKDRAKAALHGSVKFRSGDWQTTVDATQVPVSEFLSETWQPHLSGTLDGKIELTGTRGSLPQWHADLALKGGVLNSLPVLDKLATYTRMERFKRLVLDIATATVRPNPGGGTRWEKIVVQSNGLMRIEGTLTLLPGDLIEGDFMVGVTPETLRWIPGAQSVIFVEKHPSGPPGLNWARVKIAGSLASPQEDLSSRLIGAAGMSLILDTPGAVVNKAAETLVKPILGNDAAKLPGQVLDQGVKTGTDLINKVVPIFGK